MSIASMNCKVAVQHPIAQIATPDGEQIEPASSAPPAMHCGPQRSWHVLPGDQVERCT